MADALTDLARFIARRLGRAVGEARAHLDALFGGTYPKRVGASTVIRDACALGSPSSDDGIPLAGLIHPRQGKSIEPIAPEKASGPGAVN